MKTPKTTDAAIIQLLIAAGHVTREQVAKARELAKSFGIVERKSKRKAARR